MGRINFITAGESHGPMLTAVINGLPAGYKIDVKKLTNSYKKTAWIWSW